MCTIHPCAACVSVWYSQILQQQLSFHLMIFTLHADFTAYARCDIFGFMIPNIFLCLTLTALELMLQSWARAVLQSCTLACWRRRMRFVIYTRLLECLSCLQYCSDWNVPLWQIDHSSVNALHLDWNSGRRGWQTSGFAKILACSWHVCCLQGWFNPVPCHIFMCARAPSSASAAFDSSEPKFMQENQGAEVYLKPSLMKCFRGGRWHAVCTSRLVLRLWFRLNLSLSFFSIGGGSQGCLERKVQAWQSGDLCDVHMLVLFLRKALAVSLCMIL